MPDYKKRNVKKVKAKKPAKAKAPARTAEIPMEDTRIARQKKQKSAPAKPIRQNKATKAPKAKSTPRSAAARTASKKGLRVVFGGKNKKKSYFTAACMSVLILAVVLVELLTPTGMIETIQNQYALLSADGSGLDGLQGERFLKLQTTTDSIAVLSDKYFELYNAKGKTVLYDQHGFSNPQMVHSSARSLVYESGGKGLKVYNHSARLFEKTFENNIYTATVCRNGSMAVVTQSVGYASHIEVFNKNLKTIFTKDLAEDLVSAVALSPDGRYLAISILRAVGGDFESVVCGYRVKTGAKLFEHSYDGVAINTLQAVKKQHFVAAAQTRALIINFKNGAEQAVEIDRLKYLDTNSAGHTVMVHAYQGTATRHTVTVVNSLARVAGSFAVDGNIKDVALGKDRVAFLLDTQIKIYDFAGVELATVDCGFNTTLVADIAGKTVAVTGKQLVIQS